MEGGYVTEIPSYLKQLARLISYAFYQIEDTLIIDVLVRHPCMKEKDMEELLKFDLKLLRARMATLRIEKFVQLRLRMETGPDGKAQKVNYYFINYKSLVNVIKYKLDHMRKKMETQERDATNRASFKCTHCGKTFTDLEAGELFDPMTSQFQCTFCKQLVEEDESAGPKTDSRLMVARFNDQMEMIYELLRKAEDIKLAPELLEPEPPRNANDPSNNDNNKNGTEKGNWSGEATRLRGINDQTRVDIRIGDAAVSKPAQEARERPIWMVESTIGQSLESNANSSASSSRVVTGETTSSSTDRLPREDIMSVLLAFEQKETREKIPGEESDGEEDTTDGKSMFGNNHINNGFHHEALSPMEVEDEVGVIESDDEDQVTLVEVGEEKIPITEINDEIIERMSASEKDLYIQQYQEFYAHIYD